jgi:hypothetical protein
VMRLTETGRQFCQEVVPLMSRLEKTAEEMVLSSTAIRGHLRVNVDPTFARLVLVPGLGAILEAYPDLHVELAIRDEIGDLIAEPEWVSPKSFSWEPRALLKNGKLINLFPDFAGRIIPPLRVSYLPAFRAGQAAGLPGFSRHLG